MIKKTRRELAGLFASGSVIAIAGCAGDGDTGNGENGEDDDTEDRIQELEDELEEAEEHPENNAVAVGDYAEAWFDPGHVNNAIEDGGFTFADGEPYDARIVEAEFEDGVFDLTFHNWEPEEEDDEASASFSTLAFGVTEQEVSVDDGIDQFDVTVIRRGENTIEYTVDVEFYVDYLDATDEDDADLIMEMQEEFLDSYNVLDE